MGIWNNLNQYVNRAATDGMTTKPKKNLLGMFETTWGNPEGHDTLENNEAIYSVVSRLSTTLASLPLSIVNNKTGEEDDSNLTHLVTIRPNPVYSAFDFWARVETDRNVYGNSFVLIEHDAYLKPVNLWNVPAEWVSPMLDENNELWYKIVPTVKSVLPTSKSMFVSSSQMLHFKHVGRASRTWGISPLDVLTSSISYDNKFRDFTMSEMNKRDGLMVNVDTNLGDEEREALIEQVKTLAKGGVMFNESSIKIEPIERKLAQTEVDKNYEITARAIANAFNVPLSFLNVTESNTVKSNEQLMQQFVQMNLGPTVARYESELNLKLLTANQIKNGSRFYFDLDEVLRGDMSARFNAYNLGIRNGIMSPNEARKKEHMTRSNLPEADRLFQSRDLTPIDLLVEENKVAIQKGETLRET